MIVTSRSDFEKLLYGVMHIHINEWKKSKKTLKECESTLPILVFHPYVVENIVAPSCIEELPTCEGIYNK